MRFTTVPAAYTFVTGYGTDNTAAPYGFFFGSGGQINVQFALSGGVVAIPSSVKLATNTTYYVVGTFDGSTGRIFVNGVQTGSAAGVGTFTNYYGPQGFAIGDDASFGDPAFSGTLDEIAVYAGKALDPSRIQAHYLAATTGANALSDWLTMGYDNARTGYNPNETQLGTANVASLHALWPAPFNVHGEVGEPVYAAGVLVNGAPENLLIVNGESGNVYAINADTGNQVWLSAPTGTALATCPSGASFTFGPSGAPALDRPHNRVYVPDGAANVHAFDLSTGAEISGWPVTIASPANLNFIESAVTYNASNGYLYAETSSTCDIPPWYGRIVAINTSTHSIVNTFYPTQGQSGGGIWGFGGASIDPSTNNVFVATGNADTTSQPNQALAYAEQIVELSPDLSSVLAHSYATLPPSSDADYGATPLLFTPPGCHPLLAAVNKSGLFVLFDRTAINAGPTQTIQMSISSDSGDFIGVPAYDPVTNDVYVGLPATEGIYKPGLGAFQMRSDCTLDPTPVWNANFGADGATVKSDTPRSPMTIANGVVYISDYVTDTTYAFSATSGAQLWSAPLLGYGVVGPIVVNGHLYTSDCTGHGLQNR
jgi:outer membrane protein assembly factor BamB